MYRILKLQKVFIQLIAIGLLISCDAQSDKSHVEVFGSSKLINHVCDTQESVSFVIEDYKLTLPCQARELFSVSEVESHPVDYENTDYKNGLSSIPIHALHFFRKDPKIFNWEVYRPAGTTLSLYNSSHSKVSQNCKHYSQRQIYCDHTLFVSETDLTIRLGFNAGSIHALSTINISPEKYPWAYYPEDKWPELHEQTQKFVENILK